MNPADLIQDLRDRAKPVKVLAGIEEKGAVYRTDRPVHADLFKRAADTLAANVKDLAEAQEQARHYPTIAGENMRLREEIAEIRADLAEFDETNRQMVKHADIRRAQLAEIRAENERLRTGLTDIELDITLAAGISRGYDLKPALAKIRSLLNGAA